MSRNARLLSVLVIAFLTLGVPRFLAGDVGRAAPNPHAKFSKLCRERGGTLHAGAGSSLCTVRYGRRVYLMDAITADGFDQDTAGYQRWGCSQGRPRAAFLYHPTTGVCEHRARD